MTRSAESAQYTSPFHPPRESGTTLGALTSEVTHSRFPDAATRTLPNIPDIRTSTATNNPTTTIILTLICGDPVLVNG